MNIILAVGVVVGTMAAADESRIGLKSLLISLGWAAYAVVCLLMLVERAR
jgi:hypothetical protein